ncbi:MAG: ABC transporter permease, partial [Gammaproteobacteria bacterium]|nr:ABC transporter permease [Gammaproteobacteria bacterium]
MTLLRASLRYHIAHPWQVGLSLVGIALGVAVVSAIDLANGSARRAFQIANQTVSGHSTHQIIGGPVGLPEDVYRDIRMKGTNASLAPVVTGYVQL